MSPSAWCLIFIFFARLLSLTLISNSNLLRHRFRQGAYSRACIIPFHRNQEPSETADGICGFSRSVGDGNAKIVRHILYGSRGCSYGLKAGFHKLSGGILHTAVSHVVGDRVDQLDVANAAFGLLDCPCYSFIAFAAQSHGPVDGSTFFRSVGPVLTHLGEIVSEDVGGAASVGAMDYDNVGIGEFDARVRFGQPGVVPLLDFA